MSEADSREWRFYLDSIIRGDIPELLRDLRAMKAQSK